MSLKYQFFSPRVPIPRIELPEMKSKTRRKVMWRGWKNSTKYYYHILIFLLNRKTSQKDVISFSIVNYLSEISLWVSTERD